MRVKGEGREGGVQLLLLVLAAELVEAEAAACSKVQGPVVGNQRGCGAGVQRP